MTTKPNELLEYKVTHLDHSLSDEKATIDSIYLHHKDEFMTSVSSYYLKHKVDQSDILN